MRSESAKRQGRNLNLKTPFSKKKGEKNLRKSKGENRLYKDAGELYTKANRYSRLVLIEGSGCRVTMPSEDKQTNGC